MQRPFTLLFAGGAFLLLLFALISFREPMVLITIFLLCLILLPPLYSSRFGETPLYISSLLLPLAIAVIIVRWPDFRIKTDAIAIGLVWFLGGTALSLPFSWWLSGSEVGVESLSRWVLLAQTGLIYVLARGGTRRVETKLERTLVPLLMVAAMLSGLYGIIDFIWPVPIPHPAAEQHIWLRSGVVRRAQGVFYESSNFANFCALFLTAACAGFLTRKERLLRLPRAVLALAILILGSAVVVAFSRSVWANVLVALSVLISLSRAVATRRLAVFLMALSAPLLLLSFHSSELWDYVLSNRLGYVGQLFADPNLASSWRYQTWIQLVSAFFETPAYFIFGVGYKSLPHTRLFHQQIVTDNGYLNLLVECGVVGLLGFLVFCSSIFKTLWRVSRSQVEAVSFWGLVLFSFWCGECVLMLTADAYTYWRNMVVFVALVALVMNWAERHDDRVAVN
jgi:hypothetical protein